MSAFLKIALIFEKKERKRGCFATDNLF